MLSHSLKGFQSILVGRYGETSQLMVAGACDNLFTC